MPPFLPPDPLRLYGALLGTAIGDALGMPLDGLSHQNVRLYYRGVKGYAADEKRGGAAGTGTAITDELLRLARALSGDDEFQAPPLETAAAAAVAVPLMVLPAEAQERWIARPAAPGSARAATHAHLRTLARLAATPPAAFDPAAFWATLRGDTAHAEAKYAGDGGLTARLDRLTGQLDLFPLDLQDLCDGTGDAPDEAWPFAVAMFARGPHLVEATLLSAVNVGGASATVGALVGSLFGALHGPEAFPAAWREALAMAPDVTAATARLEAKAGA